MRITGGCLRLTGGCLRLTAAVPAVGSAVPTAARSRRRRGLRVPVAGRSTARLARLPLRTVGHDVRGLVIAVRAVRLVPFPASGRLLVPPVGVGGRRRRALPRVHRAVPRAVPTRPDSANSSSLEASLRVFPPIRRLKTREPLQRLAHPVVETGVRRVPFVLVVGRRPGGLPLSDILVRFVRGDRLFNPGVEGSPVVAAVRVRVVAGVDGDGFRRPSLKPERRREPLRRLLRRLAQLRPHARTRARRDVDVVGVPLRGSSLVRAE